MLLLEVIIIDSVTHVWKGQGGLLEYQNALGGRYQDWAKATPLYQKWLDSILHSSCHVITTNRKKQAYNMIQEGNRTKVEKAGMEDEIRDGYDYEMTIAFEITNDKHIARQAKDRTRLFVDKPDFVITEETGKMIRDWCEMGVEPEKPQLELLTSEHPKWDGIIAALRGGRTMAQLKEKFVFTEATETEINNLLSIPA